MTPTSIEYISRIYPYRRYRYNTPNKEELQQYPCCLDATVTKGLNSLIDDDEPFAFLKLRDGLNHRRRTMKMSNLPIEKMLLKDLLKAGYIIDTIPQHPVDIRTVERHRKRASVLAKVFGHLRLEQINEDFLWKVHAGHSAGYTVYPDLPKNTQLATTKALRKGIYLLLKKQKMKPWILQTFKTDWQTHRDLNDFNLHLPRLRASLQKHPKFPSRKTYTQFFKRSHK